MAQNKCQCGKLKDEKYELCYDCFHQEVTSEEAETQKYKLPMHPMERESMNRIVAVQSTALVFSNRHEAEQEQLVATFNVFMKLLGDLKIIGK